MAENNMGYLPDWQVLQRLEGFRLSAFHFSPDEEKVLAKFVRQGMSYEEVSPAFLVRQDTSISGNLEGFGKKSRAVLTSLQLRILSELDSTSSGGGLLISVRFGEMFTLSCLCDYLAEDLSRFASRLEGDNGFIWMHRAGYRSERLTLQEIGNELGLTRERVRQRTNDLNARFLRGMRVRSAVLREKVVHTDRASLLADLQLLQGAFCNEKALLCFFAWMAGFSFEELLQQVQPAVRGDLLDDFFCNHAFPASRAAVVSALKAELGGSTDDEADVYLTGLEQVGGVRFEGSHVVPVRRSKEVAVLHLLAGCPEGMDWKDLARKVNESGVCRSAFVMGRSDNILSTSVSVFLSASRTYSHIRFLEVDREKALKIVAEVKGVLEQSRHTSMALRVEYYNQQSSPMFGYYAIRQVVRAYGEACGVYFKGLSKADTVSLLPVAECVSQLEAVRRLFQDAKEELEVAQVVGYLAARTEGLAHFYISELIHSGEVVSLRRGRFLLRERAFADVDGAGISSAIRRVLADDPRMHHVSSVAGRVNSQTGNTFSVRFYHAFVQAFAKEQGWFVRGSLVAAGEIPVSGLKELIREAWAGNTRETIQRVEQRICASTDVLKRAVYSVSSC